MLLQEIIRKKRDGGTLSAAEIGAFVDAITRDAATAPQAAAFAMSVFFRGLSDDETVWLTTAMRDSGPVLAWPKSEFPGPVVDKHSTGGIGDNVSLLLAPLLAAVGAYVPMISGRGLGHTGGTLDKLDSIPGYVSQPDVARFRDTVRTVGCAIVGQTAELAPADRRLYAIRDVTATVESVPLIVASILSKKLAAGLETLVLDVKVGSGAFMATIEEARRLARALVDVAAGAGLNVSALLTDMDEPLAPVAGNALEVANAIANLKAPVDSRLNTVSFALGAEIMLLAGLATSRGEALSRLARARDSGAAADRFARMVRSLGGPADLVDRPERHLASAPTVLPVVPDRRGHVAAIDTRALGLAVIGLGGGRRLTSDAIDYAVGLSALAGIGAEVGPKMPLALVHARTEAGAAEAARMVIAAYDVGEPREPTSIVRETVSAGT